ncbi:MAG: hypothetical protein AVDCRST_MAG58-3552, partial [uncultured Rubrobacteraceae bacterium]
DRQRGNADLRGGRLDDTGEAHSRGGRDGWRVRQVRHPDHREALGHRDGVRAQRRRAEHEGVRAQGPLPGTGGGVDRGVRRPGGDFGRDPGQGPDGAPGDGGGSV